MTTKQTQTGFSLLMAILVASVALAIGISLLSITLKQLSLSASVRDSEVAFQVAATGLECATNIRRENTASVNAGNTFSSVECDDRTVTFNEVDGGGSDGRYRYEVERDLQIPTATGVVDRCMQFEFFVVTDAAAPGNRTMSFTGQDGVSRTYDGATCDTNNTCTIVTARGYSQSCANKNISELYPLQRELTAEF